MAEEKEKEGGTKWYKFTSARTPGTAILVVEGDVGDPKRSIGLGQVGELTEDEYERLRVEANLREVDAKDVKDLPIGLGYEYPAEKKAKGDS